MRRLLLCSAALALVLAGCGDDDDTPPGASGDTQPVTTEATSTTTSEATTTTSAPEGGPEVALERSCTSPEGFTISYPADWEAVRECGQFGPAPVDEPEPATDERTGVVSAFVDPVPYEQVVAPAEGDQARAVTTVDGRRAVRIESVVTGEGLYPEGTEAVRWIVDLSADGAGEPATLFVDAYDLAFDVDFDDAVPVLDAMARSLEIEAGAPLGFDDAVARYAGGGAPFTVAAAPAASTPATCLRLVEPADVDGAIACVEAVDAADGVALTSLEAPSGPITVGITGSDVAAIEVQASGDSVTFLPVPYEARDSRAFAVPIPPADVTSVVLRDRLGDVLAEVPVEEATRPADPDG